MLADLLVNVESSDLSISCSASIAVPFTKRKIYIFICICIYIYIYIYVECHAIRSNGVWKLTTCAANYSAKHCYLKSMLLVFLCQDK